MEYADITCVIVTAASGFGRGHITDGDALDPYIPPDKHPARELMLFIAASTG